MTQENLRHYRLQSQQISNPILKTPKEVVSWMGAMQAQDFEMCKWAVGVRLANTTTDEVQAALDKGDILRTHLLRPTWHLVTPEDIYWMLELSAKRIKSQMTARNKQLGLSPEVYKKSNKAIEKALSNGQHLTRKDLQEVLEREKISTSDNRLSHLLMEAELDKVICSGAINGKNQTYALLEARVPNKLQLPKEEALAKLAGIYFKSHCPATLQDFLWWCGLSAADARMALESVKNELISENIDGQEYYYSKDVKTNIPTISTAFLLPAFDEYLISYKDRSAMVTQSGKGRVFSSNGIFWPTIVVNGKVDGLWKRKVGKDKVTISFEVFEKLNRTAQKALQREGKRFGNFLGNKAEIEWVEKDSLNKSF